MAIVVRADVPIRADRGTAARAGWPPSRDDLFDLPGHRRGSLQVEPPGEGWSSVLLRFGVVDDENDTHVLFVEADRQPADRVFGCTGRNRTGRHRLNVADTRLIDTSCPELCEHLLEGHPECLKLLFLQPEDDRVEVIAEDHPEAALAGYSDRFGVGPSEIVEFMVLLE